MWLTQHNNLNIIVLIQNSVRLGKLEHLYDRKQFAEKSVQPMKKEFTSARGKFTGNLIEKLHSNKIMNYLADEDQSNSKSKCDLSNCTIKSYEFLIDKIKKRITSSFCTQQR